MVTTDVSLVFKELNDETIFLTFTKDGAPFNITGATIEVILKATVADSDTSGTTLTTAGVSPAITITDGPGGKAECAVSAALTGTPVQSARFRCDLIIGGKRKTAGYGTYQITDL